MQMNLYFQDPFGLWNHWICSISSRLLHLTNQKPEASSYGWTALHLQNFGKLGLDFDSKDSKVKLFDQK